MQETNAQTEPGPDMQETNAQTEPGPDMQDANAQTEPGPDMQDANAQTEATSVTAMSDANPSLTLDHPRVRSNTRSCGIRRQAENAPRAGTRDAANTGAGPSGLANGTRPTNESDLRRQVFGDKRPREESPLKGQTKFVKRSTEVTVRTASGPPAGLSERVGEKRVRPQQANNKSNKFYKTGE